MALSSEHRRLFAEEVARSREALAYWKSHASESYSLTTEARPAVADHLAACESLLREIADHSVGCSSNPMDHVKATFEWADKARALLGPAE